MKPTPLIIDTDPGIDDAVAIALALYAPELDVKLITTVAGNVGIEATTGNALKLLAYYGKDVPVAKGAAAPLIRQPEDASDIHGATGMEGFDFPEPKTELLLEKNAVEAMRDVLMAAEEPITIMPIGPLTNIALLLKVYPEVKPQIKEIVLMGGSVTRGNKGVMAEFNIYVDPEAAKIVLDSGLKITMATLDAGLGTVIPPEQTAKLKDMGKVGLMSHDLFQLPQAQLRHRSEDVRLLRGRLHAAARPVHGAGDLRRCRAGRLPDCRLHRGRSQGLPQA